MRIRAAMVLAAGLLCLVPAASRASLAPYTQNFETLVKADPAALGNDGWLVYGNVFSADHLTYLYGYGPYPAPNGSGAFCAIDSAQGGALQGTLQLSVYSDYNNTGAHGAGYQVEANTYREQTIGAGDVGNTWTFQFDAKRGNLLAPTKAVAFVKTLNPAAGYVTTNFLTVETTAIPDTWNTYTISLTVDAGLVGQLCQIGFANTATAFQSSGVFYDNLVWRQTAGADVPGGPAAGTLALRAAAPNPFRGTTRLDYSVAATGQVDLAVFDVAGRRVATLARGVVEAGPHAAAWDGRSSDGAPAPCGVYLCVLKTDAGCRTRRVVLAR